jgi:peptidoglycan/LPS O-acetylase OafA/YrhL
MSAYLLNIKKQNLLEKGEIKQFFYRRFWRIFPLYYLALIPFAYMFPGILSTAKAWIIHLLGLQLLLKTSDIPPMSTVWFIGLITVFYSLFVLYRVCILTPRKYLKVSGTIFLIIFPFITYFLFAKFEITDIRLFQYYGTFWLGIFCANNNFLENQNRLLSLSLLPIITISYFLLNRFWDWHLADYTGNFFPDLILTIIVNIIDYSSVVFFYNACQFLTKYKPLNNFAEYVAFASYGMYLFHRPIWFTLRKVVIEGLEINNKQVIVAILIFLGVPVLIKFSHWLQSTYNQAVKKIA